ncbi:hypothetical protein ACFL5O_05045 [Myxococcota bacterium]
MYRKEMNERNPMRVFEKSMHGGLGRGRIGVVAAGPGVGKTPLLVQIALDDLLRDRRVLHISHEHAVEHVRAYYNEIFHDLSADCQLAHAEAVNLELERHRLIFSLRTQPAKGPVSQRGGSSPVSRILEAIAFARDVAHFVPDVIIIDGFDVTGGTDQALQVLGQMAREHDVELWISVRTAAGPGTPGELPEPLGCFSALFDVLVFLSPEGDYVRLCLLKDHDSQELAEFHLRLDPHTMRILDEDVPPDTGRHRDARQFRLISGGSQGAEAAFGLCAERWGMTEINYSYEGHRSLERSRGVVVLNDEELNQGDFSLTYVSRRLRRRLSDIPMIRRVLQTIWHQITHSNQVFAVGLIQEDGTLRGGTGWGAELARLWKKPLFVFDQRQCTWLRWNGAAWELAAQPLITSEVFAGVGSQKLTAEGQKAIEELFLRSFGQPDVPSRCVRSSP